MDVSHDRFLWFHSFRFLLFFAVVFVVYWPLPWAAARLRLPARFAHVARKVWLLLASIVFYMSWKPLFVLLILASASVDYVAATQLDGEDRPGRRRFWLVFPICVNLGILAFFKYSNFFITSVAEGLHSAGFQPHLPTLQLILPLGVSFYTFEAISYIVDVYRGRTRALRNPLDYALYIMFFPHLIAGPIVRPHEFLPQLRQTKRWDWDRMQLAAQWFVQGLVKKAVMADHLGTVADPVFADPGAYGSEAVWLGVLAYSLQIYCDFSGYSDMAVGIAHALGYKLPSNFHMPYFAASLTDFWRRWHRSLSHWLRDYLYIPLGGNRHGRWNTYRNLLLTMLLGGLWHGANWTFVAWGLIHGVGLALERALGGGVADAAARQALLPLRVAGTFLVVTVAWVFFRAQTFADAWTLLTRMAVPGGGASLAGNQTSVVLACYGVALLAHLVGSSSDLRLAERRLSAPALGAGLAMAFLLALLFWPQSGGGFIYFQF